MMHTLGHNFMPPPVHAGGLRYHGSAPLVSHLLAAGVIEAEAYDQREVFESAVQFARCEGTIPGAGVGARGSQRDPARARRRARRARRR